MAVRTAASDLFERDDGRVAADAYDRLLEASGCVLWRATPDGVVVDALGCMTSAGRPQAPHPGQGLAGALHPDDRQRARNEWAEAVAGRVPRSVDYRVREHDGSYRLVRNRAIPIKNAAGDVVEWVGTVTQIDDSPAEQVLREREELLSLALGATGLGIWDMELPSGRTEWSLRLKELAGLDPATPMNDDVFYALVHPEDQHDVAAALGKAVTSKTRDPYSITYRVFRADTGEERWWQEWSRLVTDPMGNPARMVGAVEDVTERKQAELDRHNSEKRWRLGLAAGRMVAWEHTIETGITTMSENSSELLGFRSGNIIEFLGRVHPKDREALAALLTNPPLEGTSKLEFRFRHTNGRTLWLDTSMTTITDGGRPRIVGVTSDITVRKAAEEKLLYAASHDSMTGLLNRAALQASLDRAIATAQLSGGRVTLVILDIDNFKDINDTLGHDAGDYLLRFAAEVLRDVTGEAGIVARLGGDEFAVLVEGISAGRDEEQLGAALQAALRKGFTYEEKTHRVAASLGMACFPDHAADSMELLKCADLALYAAKRSGRARLNWFTPEMRRRAEERAAILADVQRALAQNEFTAFYQPKVDLRSGGVVGFEALARWKHPERGILTPAVFSDAFEDGELSIAIDRAMLACIVEDMSGWQGRGIQVGRVALNLSSYDFTNPDLADTLLGQLAAGNIASTNFEIEVTETVLFDNRAKSVASTLECLHEAGVKISLDDFGTGFSSLTHLKNFTVDELKIDRSFISNIASDAGDAAIVRGLIGLANALDLTVVAEGIETDDQVQSLLSVGCDYGQGYLFAKPMVASRVPWFLTEASGRQVPAVSPGRRRQRRS